MAEVFSIIDVKNEFLRNLGQQYVNSYPPQQVELALYMLNDFCNNVEANNLLLVRADQPEPQAPPQYMPPQQYPQPMDPYYQPPQRPPYVQQQRMPPQMAPPQQNPFVEYDADRMDVQSQVAEMNRGLAYGRMPPQQPQQQPRMQMPTMPPVMQQQQQSVVDLNPEKPKTFVDKIKEMRTPKKVDKINPED